MQQWLKSWKTGRWPPLNTECVLVLEIGPSSFEQNATHISEDGLRERQRTSLHRLQCTQPTRSILKLRILPKRIQRRISQKVGCRLRKREGYEHHAFGHGLIGPRGQGDAAAAGGDLDGIARCYAQAGRRPRRPNRNQEFEYTAFSRSRLSSELAG